MIKHCKLRRWTSSQAYLYATLITGGEGVGWGNRSRCPAVFLNAWFVFLVVGEGGGTKREARLLRRHLCCAYFWKACELMKIPPFGSI